MTGEFGRVMVRILANFSRAIIPMRRPDMPPEQRRIQGRG